MNSPIILSYKINSINRIKIINSNPIRKQLIILLQLKIQSMGLNRKLKKKMNLQKAKKIKDI